MTNKNQSMKKLGLLCLLFLALLQVSMAAPANCISGTGVLEVDPVEDYMNTLGVLGDEEEELLSVDPQLQNLENQKANIQAHLKQYEYVYNLYSQRKTMYQNEVSNYLNSKTGLEKKIQELEARIRSVENLKKSYLATYNSYRLRGMTYLRMGPHHRIPAVQFMNIANSYLQRYNALLAQVKKDTTELSQKRSELARISSLLTSRQHVLSVYTSITNTYKLRVDQKNAELQKIIKDIYDYKNRQILRSPEEIIKETEKKMQENIKDAPCKDKEVCQFDCKDFMKSCPTTAQGFFEFDTKTMSKDNLLAYDWVCKNDVFSGLNQEQNHLSEVWQIMAEEISGFTRKQFEDDFIKRNINVYKYDSLFLQWLQTKVTQQERILSVQALYEYKVGLKGFFRICRSEPAWQNMIPQKLKEFEQYAINKTPEAGIESDLASKAFRTIDRIKTSYPAYYQVFERLRSDYQKRFIEMLQKNKVEREYCQCRDFRRYFGLLRESSKQGQTRIKYAGTATVAQLDATELAYINKIQTVCQQQYKCIPYQQCSTCEVGSFCTQYGCYYPYLWGNYIRPDMPSGIMTPQHYMSHPIIMNDGSIFSFKIAIRTQFKMIFRTDETHRSTEITLEIKSLSSSLQVIFHKRLPSFQEVTQSCMINYKEGDERIIKSGTYQQFYFLLNKGVVKLSAGEPNAQVPLCTVSFEQDPILVYPRFFRSVIAIQRETMGWIYTFGDLQNIGVIGEMCSEYGFNTTHGTCQCYPGYSGRACEIANGPFKNTNDLLIARTAGNRIQFDFIGTIKLDIFEDVPDNTRKVTLNLCEAGKSTIVVGGVSSALNVPCNTQGNSFWISGNGSEVSVGIVGVAKEIFKTNSNVLPKRVKVLAGNGSSEIKNIQ